MTVQPADDRPVASLEVPREELLRRGRPLPSLKDLLIEDLTDEESDAFWAALRSREPDARLATAGLVWPGPRLMDA